MTLAILAAAAATMSLALLAALRPEPRRIPVHVRERDPKRRS